MALPIVMAALLAGGSLVPHAAGGLIVSSAGGYVAGTYLSTTAVSSIIYGVGLTGTATGVGLVTTALPRVASIARALKLASITGGAAATTATVATFETAAVTTTTAAATTAAASSLSTIAIPLLGISLALLVTYLYRLIKKVKKHSNLLEHDPNKELTFTETEAKVIEAMIRYLPQKSE